MALLTRRLRGARTGLAAIVLCMLAAGPVHAGDPNLEYAVKANFLYKFAPFVAWPAQAFANQNAAFRICVIGDDPFKVQLDNAVRGQRIGTHPIAVKRAAKAAPGMGCHMLFGGRSAAQTPAEMLRAVAGEPVLTVTDQSRGISGGMIQFVLRGSRVRFTIDAPSAKANGLDISSKLLELAVAAEP